MQAYQWRCVRSIRAPTQCAVVELSIVEREIGVDRSSDALLGGVWIRVRRMLRMRSRHGEAPGRLRAIRLMLLEAGKSWEFVTDLDYAVFVGLEEESDVAVVHYRTILELGSLFGGKSEVCIHPCLSACYNYRRYRWRWHKPWSSIGLRARLTPDSRPQQLERPCRRNMWSRPRSPHQHMLCDPQRREVS
jgi:hypothetical protein